MSLELDLSASDAKIARAEEHLESLKTEIPLAIKQRHPHSLSGEINPQTGWCSVRIRRHNPKEPRLAAIVGDYIHNLRSALNYIVTALVDATPGLTLGPMHQFPVYDDPTAFVTNVWRVGDRVGRGPLQGVIHGLTIIEPLQPYHTQPDPGADALAQLNRFSNADKHREILGYWADPQPGEVEIDHAGGTVIERVVPTDYPWVNDEVEIGRFRYAPPFPNKVRAKSEMSVNPTFSIQPFGKYPKGIALDLAVLEPIRVHVRMVTDLFKTI